MPTNEAGLAEGQDQGDGGRTTASDMDPAGFHPKSGVGEDAEAPSQVSTDTETAGDKAGNG
jgi:hypothetical protein